MTIKTHKKYIIKKTKYEFNTDNEIYPFILCWDCVMFRCCFCLEKGIWNQHYESYFCKSCFVRENKKKCIHFVCNYTNSNNLNKGLKCKGYHCEKHLYGGYCKFHIKFE